MDWANQGSNSFVVQGDLYMGRLGERQNIASYSPPASINIDGTQDVSGGNILGRWKHAFNEGSDFQLQAYYDRTYRLGVQLGETRNTFDIDFVHHFKALPRQDIIWGLGARWSPSDFTQKVATVDFLPHNQSDMCIAFSRKMKSQSSGINFRRRLGRSSSTTFTPDGRFSLPRACCGRRPNIKRFGRQLRARFEALRALMKIFS